MLSEEEKQRLRSGEIVDPSRLRLSLFKRQLSQPGLDISALLALAGAEPAGATRTDMLRRLARCAGLDRWRLQVLSMSPLYQDAGLQRELHKQSLLRTLRQDEADEAVLRDALASNDPDLHQALLEVSGLSDDLLATLAESGATKAVRRAARQRRTG
ncbi:MAG: hypothetical protein AAFV53_40535 [Myxococcota bacterium]